MGRSYRRLGYIYNRTKNRIKIGLEMRKKHLSMKLWIHGQTETDRQADRQTYRRTRTCRQKREQKLARFGQVLLAMKFNEMGLEVFNIPGLTALRSLGYHA